MGEREYTDADLGLDFITSRRGATDLRELVVVGFTKQGAAIKQLGRDVERLESVMVTDESCKVRILQLAADVGKVVKAETKEAIQQATRAAVMDATTEAVRRSNGYKPFWPVDARGWLALAVMFVTFLGWVGANVLLLK